MHLFLKSFFIAVAVMIRHTIHVEFLLVEGFTDITMTVGTGCDIVLAFFTHHGK